MPKRVSGPHVSVILTMPHSMRSRVYVTVRCPSVCLSRCISGGADLTQSGRRQRRCVSTVPQHGAQLQMRTEPCLQPSDAGGWTRTCYVSVPIRYAFGRVYRRPTLIVLHDKNRLSDLQSMFDTFFRRKRTIQRVYILCWCRALWCCDI